MKPPKTKLTKDQLVFAAECILAGTLDMISSGLPDCIDWKDREMDGQRLGYYERGALEAGGEALSILGSQTIDDGIGCYDALSMAGKFHEAVEQLMTNAWKDKGKSVKKKLKTLKGSFRHKDLYPDYPDCHKHAVAFVKFLLG